SAPQGAGTQAAGMIAREGVEAIVAGSFGPKVFPVFDQTNLGAFTAGQVSVEEAAQKYFADDLPVASGGAGDTSPGAAQPPAGGQRPGGGGGGAGGAGGGQGGRGRGGRGRGGGGGR
ncbi:MAG: NifB/NifX family molybdenum-iron cluster-binding protein, partial [bacterium]